jgi:hypothetical protein
LVGGEPGEGASIAGAEGSAEDSAVEGVDTGVEGEGEEDEVDELLEELYRNGTRSAALYAGTGARTASVRAGAIAERRERTNMVCDGEKTSDAELIDEK